MEPVVSDVSAAPGSIVAGLVAQHPAPWTYALLETEGRVRVVITDANGGLVDAPTLTRNPR